MPRILGALLLLLVFTAPSQAQGRPAVIELFTSQGCSSCPAADSLIGELANDDDLLVLTLPVDYWDYIGWEDTLASPAFSARQRAYAHARGDRAVYTPQAVVNGVAHQVGSNRAAIEQAVRAARRQGGAVAVEARNMGETIAVEIGAGDPGGPAQILFVIFDPSQTVAIERGENAGRTITYHNVVKRIVRLGDWDGRPAKLSVPMPADGRRCAIIVQAGTEAAPGEILGADSL